jgi:hypothetical protein
MPDLQAFAKDVWIADGPNVRDFGVMFTTRMVVVKLSDGSLWVNSPMPVPFATLKNIAELGSVRYLVAATPRHFWRLEGWHTLFPETQLWSSRTTLLTLKRPLPLTGVLGDEPPEAWADDFDQLVFKGNGLLGLALNWSLLKTVIEGRCCPAPLRRSVDTDCGRHDSWRRSLGRIFSNPRSLGPT